ncbi:hypothetical protein [Pantoea cypripedii]|uniref:Uncharacterized protein n=1 Tax=Pantoea cypripedii TaxID=55209 RepID=A0A1X1EM85_PANCY|nr:hypothetical protein [Pantoea cypripedii]ORM90078.1 hypothetical protein HA50_26260 [Pantoea cypripedii]
MTHTGMFIAALMAFVWGWLVYLRNRNHQEALRRREDERKRNQLIRLRVLENAKQEYTALLRRLGVSDRWFRHAWPLTQLSIIGAARLVRSAPPYLPHCAMHQPISH